MNVTGLAAWWGAIIATLVLAWDIYKWMRSGPILVVTTSSNMVGFGPMPGQVKDKTLIVVEVQNIGNLKTTITKLVGFHYPSLLKWFRKKHSRVFIVIPSLQPIPHVLNPGERWLDYIEQTPELEDMSRNGYLYCGVYHSSSRKPIIQRVVIPKENVL